MGWLTPYPRNWKIWGNGLAGIPLPRNGELQGIKQANSSHN